MSSTTAASLLAVSALALSFLPETAHGALSYNVTSFGTRADGATDSGATFLKAWSASCSATTPAGRFLVQGAQFMGPCKNSAVTFYIDSTVMAPSDYNVNGGSGYWILIRDVTGVSVIGGTLDWQGAVMWFCKTCAGELSTD